MMLATPRTVSSLRSASTVAASAASGARWVTTTSDAVAVLALLAHRVDGHAVLGEDGGDLGQHAGLVRHVEADVVAGDHLAHRADTGSWAYADSPGPLAPLSLLRQAATRSPSTAEAVGAPPAPGP